ncbi:MAG: DUF3095 domain-containing protein [Rhodobacteraceae bacterium]|nr:DUF3095 domain-containing protein [Paracoccaceae bacterium]
MSAFDSHAFYEALTKQCAFRTLNDPDSYAPLPDNWMIGVSDVVGSTKAAAAGKYKVVNMVGTTVISAQINCADGRAYSFVFGGDGAGFAIPPDRAEAAGATLATLAAGRCRAGAPRAAAKPGIEYDYQHRFFLTCHI